MNLKGHKGNRDQTSTLGQYLRHHSTKRKFYNRFFELLEASKVQPTVVKRAFGGFENESSRAILNLFKFVTQLLRNND